jgi:hypothetical protein
MKSVFVIMGRDEYGQYESKIGSWQLMAIVDSEDKAISRIAEYKKNDPYSGYKYFQERVQ